MLTNRPNMYNNTNTNEFPIQNETLDRFYDALNDEKVFVDDEFSLVRILKKQYSNQMVDYKVNKRLKFKRLWDDMVKCKVKDNVQLLVPGDLSREVLKSTDLWIPKSIFPCLSILSHYPPLIKRLFMNNKLNSVGIYSIWINNHGEWQPILIDDQLAFLVSNDGDFEDEREVKYEEEVKDEKKGKKEYEGEAKDEEKGEKEDEKEVKDGKKDDEKDVKDGKVINNEADKEDKNEKPGEFSFINEYWAALLSKAFIKAYKLDENGNLCCGDDLDTILRALIGCPITTILHEGDSDRDGHSDGRGDGHDHGYGYGDSKGHGHGDMTLDWGIQWALKNKFMVIGQAKRTNILRGNNEYDADASNDGNDGNKVITTLTAVSILDYKEQSLPASNELIKMVLIKPLIGKFDSKGNEYDKEGLMDRQKAKTEMNNQGDFWMKLNDYALWFQKTMIIEYKENFCYSSYQMKNVENTFAIRFSLTDTTSSQISLSLFTKPFHPHSLNPNKHEKKPFCRLILGSIDTNNTINNQKQLKFLSGIANSQNYTQIPFTNLTQGDYIILGEVEKVDQAPIEAYQAPKEAYQAQEEASQGQEEAIIISAYAKEQISFEKLEKFEYEPLINAMVYSLIESNPQNQHYTNYSSLGEPNISRCYGNGPGIIYLYYINNSSNDNQLIENVILKGNGLELMQEGNKHSVSEFTVEISPFDESLFVYKIINTNHSYTFDFTSKIVKKPAQTQTISSSSSKQKPKLISLNSSLETKIPLPMNTLYNTCNKACPNHSCNGIEKQYALMKKLMKIAYSHPFGLMKHMGMNTSNVFAVNRDNNLGRNEINKGESSLIGNRNSENGGVGTGADASAGAGAGTGVGNGGTDGTGDANTGINGANDTYAASTGSIHPMIPKAITMLKKKDTNNKSSNSYIAIKTYALHYLISCIRKVIVDRVKILYSIWKEENQKVNRRRQEHPNTTPKIPCSRSTSSNKLKDKFTKLNNSKRSMFNHKNSSYTDLSFMNDTNSQVKKTLDPDSWTQASQIDSSSCSWHSLDKTLIGSGGSLFDAQAKMLKILKRGKFTKEKIEKYLRYDHSYYQISRIFATVLRRYTIWAYENIKHFNGHEQSNDDHMIEIKKNQLIREKLYSVYKTIRKIALLKSLRKWKEKVEKGDYSVKLWERIGKIWKRKVEYYAFRKIFEKALTTKSLYSHLINHEYQIKKFLISPTIPMSTTTLPQSIMALSIQKILSCQRIFCFLKQILNLTQQSHLTYTWLIIKTNTLYNPKFTKSGCFMLVDSLKKHCKSRLNSCFIKLIKHQNRISHVEAINRLSKQYQGMLIISSLVQKTHIRLKSSIFSRFQAYNIHQVNTHHINSTQRLMKYDIRFIKLKKLLMKHVINSFHILKDYSQAKYEYALRLFTILDQKHMDRLVKSFLAIKQCGYAVNWEMEGKEVKNMMEEGCNKACSPRGDRMIKGGRYLSGNQQVKVNYKRRKYLDPACINTFAKSMNKIMSIYRLRVLNLVWQRFITHQHYQAFISQEKFLKFLAIFNKIHYLGLNKYFSTWKMQLEICKIECIITKRLMQINVNQKTQLMKEILAVINSENIQQEEIIKLFTKIPLNSKIEHKSRDIVNNNESSNAKNPQPQSQSSVKYKFSSNSPMHQNNLMNQNPSQPYSIQKPSNIQSLAIQSTPLDVHSPSLAIHSTPLAHNNLATNTTTNNNISGHLLSSNHHQSNHYHDQHQDHHHSHPQQQQQQVYIQKIVIPVSETIRKNTINNNPNVITSTGTSAGVGANTALSQSPWVLSSNRSEIEVHEVINNTNNNNSYPSLMSISPRTTATATIRQMESNYHQVQYGQIGQPQYGQVQYGQLGQPQENQFIQLGQPQNIQSQRGQPQHAQLSYQANQHLHQANQPSYQTSQPPHKANQLSYQTNQPSHQANQLSYQTNQPSHQANQPSYQSSQPSHQANQLSHQSTQHHPYQANQSSNQHNNPNIKNPPKFLNTPNGIQNTANKENQMIKANQNELNYLIRDQTMKKLINEDENGVWVISREENSQTKQKTEKNGEVIQFLDESLRYNKLYSPEIICKYHDNDNDDDHCHDHHDLRYNHNHNHDIIESYYHSNHIKEVEEVNEVDFVNLANKALKVSLPNKAPKVNLATKANEIAEEKELNPHYNQSKHLKEELFLSSSSSLSSRNQSLELDNLMFLGNKDEINNRIEWIDSVREKIGDNEMMMMMMEKKKERKNSLEMEKNRFKRYTGRENNVLVGNVQSGKRKQGGGNKINQSDFKDSSQSHYLKRRSIGTSYLANDNSLTKRSKEGPLYDIKSGKKHQNIGITRVEECLNDRYIDQSISLGCNPRKRLLDQNNHMLELGVIQGVNPVMQGVNPGMQGVSSLVQGLNPLMQGVNPVMQGVNQSIRGMSPVMRGISPTMRGMSPAMQGMGFSRGIYE